MDEIKPIVSTSQLQETDERNISTRRRGADLETAEVLQAPEFGGAVCGGSSQHLVDGGEADSPDATTVTPEHAEQVNGPLRCQGPQLGGAVLGARRQQFVVG